MRASVADLINEVVTYDEIKQPTTTETTTQVMVRVGSVTGNEWTNAGQCGVNAELKLEFPKYCYNGQKAVTFDGVRYSVYRTYMIGDKVELYLERKVGA